MSYKLKICLLLGIAIVLAVSNIYATQTAVPDTAHRHPMRTQQDTLVHRRIHEDVRSLRGHLMTSPHPVSIRQQGRQLCVTSSYRQLLPIYTADGMFFSAFRLYKGMNWLTGLPRGSYLINNHKYTIL